MDHHLITDQIQNTATLEQVEQKQDNKFIQPIKLEDKSDKTLNITQDDKKDDLVYSSQIALNKQKLKENALLKKKQEEGKTDEGMQDNTNNSVKETKVEIKEQTKEKKIIITKDSIEDGKEHKKKKQEATKEDAHKESNLQLIHIIQELKEKLKESQDEYSLAESAIVAQHNNLQEATENEQQQTEEINQLKLAIETLKNVNNNISKNFNEEKNKTQQIKIQLDETEKNAEEAMNKANKTIEDLENTLKQERQETDEKDKKHTEEIEERRQSITQLKVGIDILKFDNNKLINNLNEAIKETAEIKNQLNEAEKNTQEANDKHKAALLDIETLEKKIAETGDKDEKINLLTEDIKKHKEDNQNLTITLNTKDKKIEEAEKNVENLTTNLSSTQSLHNSTKDTISHLQHNILSLEGHNRNQKTQHVEYLVQHKALIDDHIEKHKVTKENFIQKCEEIKKHKFLHGCAACATVLYFSATQFSNDLTTEDFSMAS